MDLVTMPFGRALVDWAAPVERVLYDLARRHGESPLDRGRALRRRLHELAVAGAGFAGAWDALAAERGYRWASTGNAALSRVISACRIIEDVLPALEGVSRAGIPVVIIGDADPQLVESVLRPLDGAIDDVIDKRIHAPDGSRAGLARALQRMEVEPDRVLHVCVAPSQVRAARELGVTSAWLDRTGAAAPADAPAIELDSLAGLLDVVVGRLAVAPA